MKKNKKLFSPYQYDHVQEEATPVEAPPSVGNSLPVPLQGRKNSKVGFLAALAVMVVIAMVGFLLSGRNNADETAPTAMMRLAPQLPLEGSKLRGENDDLGTPQVTMPAGVNFGSWLSLEDYFFVGDTGAVEVATPDANKAAVCLPPLHTGKGPIWQSETDLLSSLIQDVGVARTLKVFHAHRTSYVTESDIIKLSSWGVAHVRIPLSWCFTDHRFEDIVLNNSTQAYKNHLLGHYTCEDPYYEGVRWPAVPKSLLTNILRICAKHGITASLDLHTYPGATSPGTFSGLWPKQPKFWYHDQPEDPQNDLGRTLYRNFIQWVESLATEDPQAFEGILGISPMNEPAHLAGVFRDIPGRNYLPPLPPDLAHHYLVDRLGNHPDIANGPHVRVLLWLQDALDFFQQSTLPALGKQLHMNIHESALSIPMTPQYKGDGAGLAINFIAAWWSRATTQHQRSTWAVLDVHHYDAWSPECQGTSDGPPTGNYTCTDDAAKAETMSRCSSWATQTFRKHVDEHCESTAQLMTGEFSTSTHHSVKHACNDLGTLQASYKTQIQAAQAGNVKLYYWSYKMPHGGAFRNAWSFSHLMYLFGINPHPDVSMYNCGGRIHHPDEVTDDWFD